METEIKKVTKGTLGWKLGSRWQVWDKERGSLIASTMTKSEAEAIKKRHERFFKSVG